MAGQIISIWLKNIRDLALGGLSTKLTDYAEEYPKLTTALAGAEVGIKAMTAAAVVFSGLQFLTGGNKLPSNLPVPPTAPPIPGKGIWGWGSKLLGAGMSATALATFTTNEEDEEIANGSAKWAQLRAQYGQEKIDKARKLYQPWYQVGSGYANENEEWLNRLAQDEAKGTVPNKSDDSSWWSSPTSIGSGGNMAAVGVPSYLMPQQNQNPQPIQVTTKLEVDGRVLAEVVNDVNGNQAVRGPTGG